MRGASCEKRGGDFDRCEINPDAIAAPADAGDLIALDEALDKLSRLDPPIAVLVKLRYFADLTIPQAAEILGISPRTATYRWKYAKAWLRDELGAESRTNWKNICAIRTGGALFTDGSLYAIGRARDE